MISWILFALFAGGTLGAALMVVRTHDLVHSVLWLAAALLGTAGLYVSLDAGFMAAIQVLLYTGGIVTLMLFSVLLVRRTAGDLPAGGTDRLGRAALLAAVLFGMVALAVLKEPQMAPPLGEAVPTQVLGALLLGDLALPFEALSVLLLAAMIGAIVLARRKDA